MYIFWLKDEARAFAAKKNFDCASLEEIAIEIAQLEKKNKKKKRYVVITQVFFALHNHKVAIYIIWIRVEDFTIEKIRFA